MLHNFSSVLEDQIGISKSSCTNIDPWFIYLPHTTYPISVNGSSILLITWIRKPRVINYSSLAVSLLSHTISNLSTNSVDPTFKTDPVLHHFLLLPLLETPFKLLASFVWMVAKACCHPFLHPPFPWISFLVHSTWTWKTKYPIL